MTDVRKDLARRYPKMVAKAKRGSRAAAIRLFCLECMGGSSSDVAGCTAPKCPLFAYRSGTYEKDLA